MILRPSSVIKEARTKKEIGSLETLILLATKEPVLNDIKELANQFNERINGKIVTYLKGKKINFTNICKAKCKICSFYRLKDQRDAYYLTAEQIIQEIKRSHIHELVLQGGLNPDLNIKYHTHLLKKIKSNFPNLHIRAYSPTEISFISKRARLYPKDVLKEFKDAGLSSLNGDSAEILNDKVRKKICSDKLKTSDWIDIIKLAHNMNIPTSATMLLGHIETEIFISEHIDIIKRIQRDTNYFTSFEIIPFVPANTLLAKEKSIKNMISLEKLLKVCALTRLALANTFKNIQIDWIKGGLETALETLKAGVNDLGILSFDEHEIRNKNINGRTTLTASTVESGVYKIGKVPMQRMPYSIKRPRYNFINTTPVCEASIISTISNNRLPVAGLLKRH